MTSRPARIALAVSLILLVPLAAAHLLLRASLPPLDGSMDVPGVTAPVTIERDALGIPTVLAENRADLAFGTGFVHGQDRFFQMDLSRRLAAGELSELFGAAAVEQDVRARIFRFRHIAAEVIAQATPEQRAVIEAYARGVNAGLASLRSRPWEYWLLRAQPAEWRVEDSILVAYAMWWDLQYSGFRREMARRQINARIGGPECEDGWKCALSFLYPARTPWDAPNVSDGALSDAARPFVTGTDGSVGAPLSEPGIPTPDELNVRTAGPLNIAADVARDATPRMPARGSNNWAVAGRLTASGAALVANDMHLGLRIPSTWYRARLQIKGAGAGTATDGTEGAPDSAAAAPGGTAAAPGNTGAALGGSAAALDLNGVTLPGVPLLIAGSNGHVAWGFTNSYGDWLDVQPVECLQVGSTSLVSGGRRLNLSVVEETIHVRDGEDVVLPVKWLGQGVLMSVDENSKRCWLAFWLAQVPAATNLNLMRFERARSVSEVLRLAAEVGIPHQNLVVGDRNGNIGWTVIGRIPTESAAERNAGRSPWRSAEQHPRIVNPAVGLLWSANARPSNDPAAEEAIGGDEATLGADYEFGARARQIRDSLMALDGKATAEDMLRIQLDDRALLLARWRALLVDLLDTDALREHPQRAEFKRLLADWNGHAAPDSVAFRLVREYRNQTEQAVWHMILGALGIDAGAPVPSQFETPLWTLITTQPLHMLAADYADWREFLLVQVDETARSLAEDCGSLEMCTWSTNKKVHVRHPLSAAVPALSRLLDMPPLALPGDHDMPRVQDGAFGASERFAVAPGFEEQGYLHIAGGQSGHFLSPYYRAGFRAWAEGRPLPFLPGPTEHRLTLRATHGSSPH